MIDLQQIRWQAIIARLYWRGPKLVDCVMTETGLQPVYEMQPRRFAWLIRPFYRPEPIEG